MIFKYHAPFLPVSEEDKTLLGIVDSTAASSACLLAKNIDTKFLSKDTESLIKTADTIQADAFPDKKNNVVVINNKNKYVGVILS